MSSLPKILAIVAALLCCMTAAGGSVQEADSSEAPTRRKSPPISTSRFAPEIGSFRELRMIGEPAPDIPRGPVLAGEPPTGYVDGVRTVLLFWSPLMPSSAEQLRALALNTRDRRDVEGIAVALGSEGMAKKVLADLQRRVAVPTVVVDEDERSRASFLEPLGLESLPAIVVIDADGTVMFHGPASGSSIVLGQILAGSWNPDRYVDDALEWGARQQVLKEANRLHGLARRGRATIDDAIAVLDEAAALDPRNEVFQVRKFDLLLMTPDRCGDAYELGRALMERFPRSALTLNDLAWHVASYRGVSDRDLDFALEASRRSNALQGWIDPAHLDTLARVHWLRGERADAIRWQREAVAHGPDSWYGDAFRENLRLYTDGSLAPGEMPPAYVSPRRPAR